MPPENKPSGSSLVSGRNILDVRKNIVHLPHLTSSDRIKVIAGRPVVSARPITTASNHHHKPNILRVFKTAKPVVTTSAPVVKTEPPDNGGGLKTIGNRIVIPMNITAAKKPSNLHHALLTPSNNKHRVSPPATTNTFQMAVEKPPVVKRTFAPVVIKMKRPINTASPPSQPRPNNVPKCTTVSLGRMQRVSQINIVNRSPIDSKHNVKSSVLKSLPLTVPISTNPLPDTTPEYGDLNKFMSSVSTGTTFQIKRADCSLVSASPIRFTATAPCYSHPPRPRSTAKTNSGSVTTLPRIISSTTANHHPIIIKKEPEDIPMTPVNNPTKNLYEYLKSCKNDDDDELTSLSWLVESNLELYRTIRKCNPDDPGIGLSDDELDMDRKSGKYCFTSDSKVYGPVSRKLNLTLYVFNTMCCVL